MGFNENAFMMAGTAIAIFGVGIYLWDTRKDKVTNAYNQYKPMMPQYEMTRNNISGGKRKNITRKNKNHKK